MVDDTAINLDLTGAQPYDVATGRFTRRRPGGFASGDANLYRYMHNGPTMAVDLIGLQDRAADWDGANRGGTDQEGTRGTGWGGADEAGTDWGGEPVIKGTPTPPPDIEAEADVLIKYIHRPLISTEQIVYILSIFPGPGAGGIYNPAPNSGPYRGKPGEAINPTQVDVYRGGRSLQVKPGEIKVGKDGLVQPTHGMSLETDPSGLGRFGGASKVKSVPDELQIIQRGKRDTHFELVPKRPMTPERFQELANQIELE